MKKKFLRNNKMPCFGALLAQIQAKVKFLQILDCHFLSVKSLFLITKFIFKVIPCSFMELKNSSLYLFKITCVQFFFRANNPFDALIPFFLFIKLKPFISGGSLTLRQNNFRNSYFRICILT